MKLEVGKIYDRADGEIVKIVYQQDYIFIGIISKDKNLITDYYNFKGADSCNRPNFDLVREHSVWSNVKKDTLVRVSTGFSSNNLRYFDRYENGEVYCFSAGRTSYTNTVPSKAWHPTRVKLYNKEED